MGDTRYHRALERVRQAESPAAAVQEMPEEDVIQALAAAAAVGEDARFVNVLATAALNRVRRVKLAALHMAEGLVLADAEGRVNFVNPAAERLLGLPGEELLGRRLPEVLFPSSGRPCALAAALRTGQVERRREEMARRDGSSFLAAMVAAPIRSEGIPLGAAVVMRDVTEEARAELALRESEAFHHALFEGVREGIVVADRSRTIMGLNPAFTEITGWTLEDLRGGTTRRLYVHEEDFQELGRLLREREGDGAARVERTYEWRRRDGSMFMADITASYARDREGHAWGLIGTVRDATQRVADQRAVQESVAWLEAVLSKTPTGLALVDADLRVLRVNERLAQLGGLPVEAHPGRSLHEVLPDAAPAARDALRRAARAEEPALGVPAAGGALLVDHHPVRARDGRLLGLALVVHARATPP